MIEAGRDELTRSSGERACRRRRSGARSSSQDVSTELSYVDLDTLLAAVGEHHVSARVGRPGAGASVRDGDPRASDQLPTTGPRSRAIAGRTAGSVGVHVEGLDDVIVRLSRCCTPGARRRDHGIRHAWPRRVSVHRTDCANAMSLCPGPGRPDDRRRVGQRPARQSFKAAVEVVALDRSRAVARCRQRARRSPRQHRLVQTYTGDDRVARMRFGFELSTPPSSGGAQNDQADRRASTTPIASSPAPPPKPRWPAVDPVSATLTSGPAPTVTLDSLVIRALFQTSPGMRDILPPESARWRRFTEVFAEVVEAAGYGQIIPPMLEDLGVFTRLGEATDVVTKEMYDFVDKGGRHVALRPGADGQRVPGVRRAPAADAMEGLVRRARTSATRSPSAAATGSSTRSASRCSAPTTRTSTSR